MSALPSRLGCSTISMQHLDLPGALDDISALGFEEIDLGALPGVCDHVPFELTDAAIDEIAATVAASGLRVRSVNGDVGDLNRVAVDPIARRAHVDRLARLTASLGAEALVLPCGSLGHEPAASLREDVRLVGDALGEASSVAEPYGVAIWVESLHYLRLCWNDERARLLHSVMPSSVRAVLDVAHVVAAGEDPVAAVAGWGGLIAHVHLRDGAPGDFSRPFGTGEVDFAAVFSALDRIGYRGGYALEMPASAYSGDATNRRDDVHRRVRLRAVGDAAAGIARLLTG